MKKRITTTLIYFFVFLELGSLAQMGGAYLPGQACANCSPNKSSNTAIMNGTASIATSYTASACGLNYVQASVRLNQRAFGSMTVQVGNTQPATLTISGIPPCANIIKAFLYACTVGSGTTISASLTGPLANSAVFPMTSIGTASSVCWGTPSTDSYRADVTSIVTGNGNYLLSGIPTSANLSGDDAEGATLFVIYSDPSQAYTGNIVIADGCQVTGTGSSTMSANVTGFNVCATPSLSSHFMLVGDLQGFADTQIGFNSAVPNFTKTAASDQVWDFITAPGNPLLAGQSSINYLVDPSAGFDCVALVMAGSYYRTACLTCPAPNQLNVLIAASPSCPAGASVTASGGQAPYTYTWTGTSQTGSVVSGLSAGTYTVWASDANACKTGSAAITLFTQAAPIAISSTQSVCIGFSLALSAGPAVSYTWSPLAPLFNSSSATVAALPLTTTVFTVAYTNSLGCVGTQTTQVVVTYTQSSSAVNATICAGQTLTFATGSTGSTYLWTGPNGFFSLQNTMQIPNAGTQMSGIYNNSVITAPGCTITSSRIALVNPVPSQTLSGNSTLCAGGTLTVTTNNSGATYLWSGPNAFSSSAQGFTIANATPFASGAYSLAATFTNGCSSTSVLAVNVYTNPVISLSSYSPACENAPYILGANGGSTYQWLGPNGFASAAQNNTIIAQLSNAGAYQLTVTSVNGCQTNTTVTLNVLAQPVMSASGATLCSGNTASLTATGPTFFSWAGPNNFSSSSQNITVPATAQAAGVYTVTGLGALNSCSSTVTVTLSALPLPTVTASGTVVCFGSTATLTANGAITYSWVGPSAFSSISQNIVIPVANSLSSGNYTVTGTAANSCTNSNMATLSAMPLPTLSTSNLSVCEGQPAALFVNGSPLSYTWTGPGGFTANFAAAVIFASSLSNSGTYTVTGIAANTCTANATMSLTVMPLPALAVSGATVCEGNAALLMATGAQTYAWSGPMGTSTGSLVFIPVAGNSNAGAYTVTGSGLNTCSVSALVSLVILPLPLVTATGATVCLEQPAVLSASGGATYFWTGPGAFVSTSATAIIPFANQASAQLYTVVATGANLCNSSTTVVLQTLPLPQLSVSPVNTLICSGESIMLNAGGAITYTWTSFGTTNPITVAPLATAAYTLTGTGSNGCVNSTSLTIVVDRCTSAKEISALSAGVIIFPNPSKGDLMIQSAENVTAALYNSLGQLIDLLQLNSENDFKWSLRNLSKGVYYFIPTTGQNAANQKIIIE